MDLIGYQNVWSNAYQQELFIGGATLISFTGAVSAGST